MSQADLQKTVDTVLTFTTASRATSEDFGTATEVDVIESVEPSSQPDEAGSDDPESVELPPAKEADRP